MARAVRRNQLRCVCNQSDSLLFANKLKLFVAVALRSLGIRLHKHLQISIIAYVGGAIYLYVHNTVLFEFVGNFVFVVSETQPWALSTV